jgi:hypothetical protein
MGGLLFASLLFVPRPVLSGPELLADTGARPFLVHYTQSGADAAQPQDVSAVVSGIETVYDHWVSKAGMRAPLPDGGVGGDSRIDVYVHPLNGPRGNTYPEEVGQSPAASAWIEVDPRSALSDETRLAAAAGHETHHAIQYAYSTQAEKWIYEATAAYVEHADFTSVSLQNETDAHYAAILDHPEIPLDTFDGTHEYDEMVFLVWIDDRLEDPGVAALWSKLAMGSDVLGVFPDGPSETLFQFANWLVQACPSNWDARSQGNCTTRHPPLVTRVILPGVALPLALAARSFTWLSIDSENRSGACDGGSPLLDIDVDAGEGITAGYSSAFYLVASDRSPHDVTVSESTTCRTIGHADCACRLGARGESPTMGVLLAITVLLCRARRRACRARP